MKVEILEQITTTLKLNTNSIEIIDRILRQIMDRLDALEAQSEGGTPSAPQS